MRPHPIRHNYNPSRRGPGQVNEIPVPAGLNRVPTGSDASLNLVVEIPAGTALIPVGSMVIPVGIATLQD